MTIPAFHACLNAAVALFILSGVIAIKRHCTRVHRVMMGGAVLVSTVFLISYIRYHFVTKIVTPYLFFDWTRPVYFVILISHTILAVLILPFILRAVYLAIKGRFDQHRRITRWLWPVWLYVAVTGVVIYLMLYTRHVQ